MTHLSENEIALSVTNDTGLAGRVYANWHYRSCPSCRSRRDAYLAAREQLRRDAEQAPADLQWDRLAAEMTANIHLGLAAGACVSMPAPVRRESRLSGLRPVLVLASAVVIVTAAWWANSREGHGPQIPTNLVQTQALQHPSGVTLEVHAGGIGVNDNGSVLTLKHPTRGDVAFSVSSQGAVRARFVDSETGQVTINNVYAQ
jgi:hypothetical protein